ncbi:hypothetical protein ACH429_24695 [Streptomyces pathocidini]|uniref:Uncharacterized protein n=1 Tax=Streptomyces pathocidini TaxID=1650571 RepID=A0ABW7UXF8_9ACTN|nr:hypothetical protein [Streptomyces pathocidini]
MSLPGADELFRTTGGMALQASSPGATRQHANGETTGTGTRVPAPAGEQDPAAGSGEEEPDSGAAPDARSGTGEADGDDAPAEHGGREGDGERLAEGRTAPQAQAAQARPQARTAPDAAAAGRQRSATGTAGSGGSRPTAAGVNAAAKAVDGQARRRSRAAARRPSGRERHDEKITVYVSAEELMDLEHARLVLRGEHGLAVDRGRIVREAVAVVLADLESRGDASILVRRLRGR